MSTAEQRHTVQARHPKDKAGAAKLQRLIDNLGLSPEVLAMQVGVSGKQIRRILDTGHYPDRRVRFALARRFDLLPAHIWKSCGKGMGPGEMEHMLDLARRDERQAA